MFEIYKDSIDFTATLIRTVAYRSDRPILRHYLSVNLFFFLFAFIKFFCVILFFYFFND